MVCSTSGRQLITCGEKKKKKKKRIYKENKLLFGFCFKTNPCCSGISPVSRPVAGFAGVLCRGGSHRKKSCS